MSDLFGARYDRIPEDSAAFQMRRPESEANLPWLWLAQLDRERQAKMIHEAKAEGRTIVGLLPF